MSEHPPDSADAGSPQASGRTDPESTFVCSTARHQVRLEPDATVCWYAPEVITSPRGRIGLDC